MAMEHLKGLIFILIILWLIWFFSGGPSKKEEKPFINPPTQTN